MKNIGIAVIGLFVIILLSFGYGCGGGSSYTKPPTDDFIKEMSSVPKFTIILYDMDVEGSIFETFKHKYQIIKEIDSIPEEKITDWYEVDEDFFNKHIEDMGMEIVSKSNGVVKKETSPAGYSNYVGNSQYGQWRTDANGGSFWEFYGKYTFISSMFNMISPARRSYYDDYSRNYRGSGRPYYGKNTSTGRNTFGTSGTYGSKNTKNKTWFSKSSNTSFKNKVNSRVARSKQSRSGSRYSSSSRSRSRSFGK